ncbi:MAG: hypothetical protein V2G33_04660 [bacterium JZ-2024 1]
MGHYRRAFFGIFPRTEALVKATQDWERKRITEEELQKFYEEDYRFWLNVQKEIGAEPFVDGMLNWDDLFHPLAEIYEGIQRGPLTRFLETNTFYRPLRLASPLYLKESELEKWSQKYFRKNGDSWAICLPGIHALHHHFSRENERISYEFCADLLSPLLNFLAQKRGFSFFHLMEPWLFPAQLNSQQTQAYRSAFSTLPPLKYILHPWSVSPSSLPFYISLPITGLKVDATGFLPECWKGVEWKTGIELYLGIIDMRQSRMEKIAWLREYVERVESNPGIGEIILTGTTDPVFLPASVAKKKMELVKEI